ncbi:MAG: glycosyl hydrolase family 9 [Rariglobus sp.]|nr:glycosyl hydrolase family 9 [Rariglobus sp.]
MLSNRALPGMSVAALATAFVFLITGNKPVAAPSPPADYPSLALPAPGGHAVRVLSPRVIEVTWITGGPESSSSLTAAGLELFNAIQSGREKNLPVVTVAGKPVAVSATGFKRRPVYAPLRHRDLRAGNFLYLQLAEPVKENQDVTVVIPSPHFPTSSPLTVKADPLRFSPAIHVNQTGYVPGWRKTAMVGFYLGTMGELEVPVEAGFQLVDARSHEVVHRGKLVPRADQGFPFPWYQRVLAADFSTFKTPGEYYLVVPGLGASHRFLINEGVPAAFARTYALGLYHQRCGTDNSLPFTRHVHGSCHTAPAEVPTLGFEATAEFLQSANKGIANPAQSAPPLISIDTSLYPYVKRGKIDVSGGHHDAGDYSKYTINSAGLIHHLVFAADSFPGAGELDNLGLPESGDGKSDLLQEAKWEADFLIKMQDDDGGFYFLVYPKDRRYEGDVLPDKGDPQVVWPKNTAVTAAAVAALAQCASSPRFKRQFPEDAARYLRAARKGWDFLAVAIKRHGKDGAYQKLTHYGDEFGHNDELVWAACELFAATGEAKYHTEVRAWLDPSDSETRRWGWWRLCESNGRAIRSYAFSVRSGRLTEKQVEPLLLARCENEIIACADDWLSASQQSAYGVYLPEATKRMLGAGWFFPLDGGFDLATACQLDYPKMKDPRADFFAALLTNLNYEAGTNPVNQSYLTGLGWQRQREIVHHYALNDHNVLPPSGIPIGSIQAGFGWLDPYKQELGALCFPPDGDKQAPYPIYDRWGDSFNLSTEFVIVNQARALGVLAWLMAQTPLRGQSWKTATATISGLPDKADAGKPVTARLNVSGHPDLDPNTAHIIWETRDQEPVFGGEFTFKPRSSGDQWVEAEAQWPDGRRVFATGNFPVTGR